MIDVVVFAPWYPGGRALLELWRMMARLARGRTLGRIAAELGLTQSVRSSRAPASAPPISADQAKLSMRECSQLHKEQIKMRPAGRHVRTIGLIWLKLKGLFRADLGDPIPDARLSDDDARIAGIFSIFCLI